MTEFGGYLMIGKLTRPCVVTSTDYSITTIFKGIKKNALIIVDNTRLQNLVTAVATAVDGGYFNRCGVVLLLDSSVAANNDELTRLNIRMRALWSAGIAVIKPWTGFLTRTSEGNFNISDVDGIAARVDQGMKRLPKLLNNPATRLVGVHRSGRPIFNGPKAPLLPKMEILISKEVCEYVRAVIEAETAEDAIKAWTPADSSAKKVKRLQPTAKNNRGRGSSSRARGRGGSRGGKRGGGRGGHGRGRGGFRGSSRGSYGPTFLGIHYHNW